MEDNGDWHERIPDLLGKIQSARSHASLLHGPKMVHRLSVGGQDAALLKVGFGDEDARRPSIAVADDDWSPSCKVSPLSVPLSLLPAEFY